MGFHKCFFCVNFPGDLFLVSYSFLKRFSMVFRCFYGFSRGFSGDWLKTLAVTV